MRVTDPRYKKNRIEETKGGWRRDSIPSQCGNINNGNILRFSKAEVLEVA
jgi:hypothetical protein